MNNRQLYNTAFVEVFSVDEKLLNDLFSRDNVENWDSLRQLSLTTNIEDAFGIMFDPEDILGFDSYTKGTEILRKYEIEL